MLDRRGCLVIVLSALAGCGRASDPRPGPLLIAAASDLQAVVPELTELVRQRSGRKVEFVLGSSANLALQVRQGAPFDLFLSADRSRVDTLAADGLLRADSVRSYAVGSLALVSHMGTGLSIESLADLRRPEVRHIAIANPDLAPYGAAAKRVLQGAGLWAELEPKLVLGETVRQALQFVQSGNAEAGLVGRAIADVPEVTTTPIDPGLYPPIVQALGIVAASRQQDAAGEFAALLLGPPGQSILARHGFQPPPDAP